MREPRIVTEAPVTTMVGSLREARARTAQDILAERRSVVQEQRGEKDPTVRGVLQWQIDELDRELERLGLGRAS